MVPPNLLPVPLGQIVATPAALGVLTQPEIVAALRRHASGDWGNVDAEDRAANDDALHDGTRLLSVYQSASGTTFWVITEADRSVTTVLLPDDY
ncbi:hypothetical protein J0H58_12060 [bacterium]|nr:hypothetical protein [bacterium]